MSSDTVTTPEKIRRHFFKEGVDFDRWESLEPYFVRLAGRPLETPQDLLQWLKDVSEVESAVQEHAGWLYIRMTCDTTDKERSDAYKHFIEVINPEIELYQDRLNRKLADCPVRNTLDERYSIYLKQIENSIRIFREENIPLNARESVKQQKYGEVAGAMVVEVEGKALTLQQASNYLRKPDRNIREEVFHKITSRRLQDRLFLDELFNELIQLRHQIAVNAGFKNYRDYKFVQLDRFDYSPDDCLRFHESVKNHVVPVLNDLFEERRSEMHLVSLKPWDLDVDPQGRQDLRPFATGEELMKKTIDAFAEIHPYFGEVTRILRDLNYVDLDSRKGKAPGGYNYPLYESGVPFIFMNASGSLRDVITMVHEGGHAIHSMLTRDLDFVGFKELPSEIAELASMSMELISMEHWHHFFPDRENLRRAKKEQLENVLEGLPWIACIDHFQHWLYTHPGHTIEQRTDFWKKNYAQFNSSLVDWSNDNDALEAMWQKQLHLFEVPFYYIEYGMAQLGAIAVWKNYKEQPEKAIRQYMEALSLGYTRSISEVYKAAGIRFDFSENYIRELIGFVRSELEKV
ncbi:MAG: M3 family oligoendopeptidase [Bacteroidia bacterium]|nr:M3 family oligoendopeptidase [Bacteroidia bacterium]